MDASVSSFDVKWDIQAVLASDATSAPVNLFGTDQMTKKVVSVNLSTALGLKGKQDIKFFCYSSGYVGAKVTYNPITFTDVPTGIVLQP
jgi:hypothetical protein